MRGKPILAGITAAGIALAVAVVGGSAAGASAFLFDGYAGGTQVKAVNNTITSALSAQSTVWGPAAPLHDSNSLLNVTAQKVVTVGAVQSSADIKQIVGGWEVTSTVHAADVNVLNGAITATAVDTTGTVSVIGGVAHASATTRFLGLKIIGTTVPKVIPQNFGVRIPGLATVVLNGVTSGVKGAYGVAIGTGLGVTLLKSQGQAATGAEIYVSPVFDAVAPTDNPPTGHTNSGQAYGSRVAGHVSNLADVRSDPTAPVTVFAGGTSGKTVTNSIAAVNLSPTLRLGAITDTGYGTNTTSGSVTQTTSRLAGINLFDGLIKATAVGSHASADSGGTASGGSTLVDLTIAGHSIPVDAAPNTRINVLNLGTVYVNQQIRSRYGIAVRALDVVLTTAAYGLPAGAEVQVAVSSAYAA